MPARSYWPTILIDGAALDLRHLEPVLLPCAVQGREAPLDINIRYSNHCFTEAFDDARHDPAWTVMDHQHRRVFDPARYDLSKMLPNLMRKLPSAKVHQTPERRNYVYSTILPNLTKEPYQIFFTLRKAHGGAHDLDLFVESAYVLAGGVAMVRRPNAIRFQILALKIFRNEPIRFAPR